MALDGEKTKDGNLKLRTILTVSLLILLSYMISECVAAEPEKSFDLRAESVIRAFRIRQIGDSKVLLELKGVNLSRPALLPAANTSAILMWKSASFEKVKGKLPEGYGWQSIELNGEGAAVWSGIFEYPLAQRANIVRGADGSVTMRLIGNEKLNVMPEESGLQNDVLTIVLERVRKKTRQNPSSATASDDLPSAFEKKITLDLKNADLADTFRLIASLAGLNIVVEGSVPKDTVTATFKNAKFSDVFFYLLKMKNLSWGTMSGTLLVGSPESVSRVLEKRETKAYIVSYADINKLPVIMTSILSLPKIPIADERTGTLYVTASTSQHARVETLLEKLDHPGRQVMLEARLVEVNENATKELEGMLSSVYDRWLLSYGSEGGFLGYQYSNSEFSPLGDGFFLPVADSVLRALDAGLRALEEDNRGKVLASPSVVALDREKAVIKLTRNYLYQSNVDDKDNPKFKEQETGPILEITPRLGRDGFITLKLKIATGEIIGFRKSGKSEVPEMSKREVETMIRVRDGELFVIGGLYKENTGKTVSRVPVLGDIPLLGELFTTRTKKNLKSEMAFIVVPHILDIPSGNAESYPLF